MNEFLRDLATLGLGAGALVALGTFVYILQRQLRQRFARKSQERKLQAMLVLLCIACIAIAVWLVPVIDAPRRPLFDYLGILLTLAGIAAAVALARDLLAGLQLRLRGVPRVGACIRAGDYVGQVSRRGLLQVVLTTTEGDSVHLPNRFLLQVPLRVVISGSTGSAMASLSHTSSIAAPADLQPAIAAFEPAVSAGYRAAMAPPVVTARREPVLTVADQFAADAQEPVVQLAAAEPAIAPVVPVDDTDPQLAAELLQLKNEYTELSQQLLQVERALQEAGQGPERQPLSLEKKKLEARLIRLDKQIGQLQSGERRRA